MEIDKNKFDLALANKCYTMQDLKKAANLGSSTISNITGGKLLLKPKTIGKIAKALNLKVKELIKD